MELTVTKNPNSGKLPDSNNLVFGRTFTDHMFLMDYTRAEGWKNARIVPYGPITLDPAASVFHYGAEVFEGLKAYRKADGSIQLFRPWENMKRMQNSALRMGLPAVPEDLALEAVLKLVELDQAWVPSAPGTSLYVRPFIISVDADLAVHGVSTALFCVILSPVGSYFSGGLKPVKMMFETEDVRAVRGGTGYAKCGGTYAASNRAANRATEKGYDQVLWLDGVERKYIEEGGAMNIMFKIDGTVVTPALTGSILPGITRDSCIRMMQSWGLPVEERLVSVDEVVQAAKEGRLEECWCCGTAAVISPVGALGYGDEEYVIHDMQIGEVSQKLYDSLTDIQWGRAEDPFQWTCPVTFAE